MSKTGFYRTVVIKRDGQNVTVKNSTGEQY